jgi:hypothetical protein
MLKPACARTDPTLRFLVVTLDTICGYLDFFLSEMNPDIDNSEWSPALWAAVDMSK